MGRQALTLVGLAEMFAQGSGEIRPEKPEIYPLVTKMKRILGETARAAARHGALVGQASRSHHI